MGHIHPEKRIELERIAKSIRRDIVEMTTAAGSGHPGGSLSATDVVTCLYFNEMKHKPDQPAWSDRDRFILSKGHACPVLYSALAESGYFPVKELLTFRKLGSRLQGHPCRKKTIGVEVPSGSLGQGLSAGIGMALAARLDKKDYRVYVLLGDGECQEGQVWEAAMAAAHYKVDNLCAIVDFNNLQIDGRLSDVMGVEPFAAKWESFGWKTLSIDGHDLEQITGAFAEARATKGRPTMILAKTIKGKGVSFMEGVADWHGKAPSKEQCDAALKELRG